MSHKVGGKLAFDAVFRLCPRRHHDCSIVDKDVDLLDSRVDGAGGFSYGSETTEVEIDESCGYGWICGIDFRDDGVDLGERAASENNRRRVAVSYCHGSFCTDATFARTSNEDLPRVSQIFEEKFALDTDLSCL